MKTLKDLFFLPLCASKFLFALINLFFILLHMPFELKKKDFNDLTFSG